MPSTATFVVPPGYLPINDTVGALGRSIKTVERLVAAGELDSKLIAREGRKPERVYSASDIERLKRENMRRRERRLATIPSNRQISAPPPATASVAISPDSLTALREAMSQLVLQRSAVPISQKLWLTLQEAAEYSGLSQTYLRESCIRPGDYREGENLIGVRGGPHGALRIQRASLDAFSG